MKILLSFLLALAGQALSAQTAHVGGTLTARLADTVEVEWWNHYARKSERRLVPLDKAGGFLLELPTPYAYNLFALRNGTEATDLVLAPGADLRLVVDAAHFDSTLRYSGAGSVEANLVAEHVRRRGLLSEFGRRMQARMALPPDSAVSAWQRSLDIEMEFLKQHSAAVPEAFRQWWTALFTYEMWSAMLAYPMMHEVARTGSFTIQSTAVSAESRAVASSVPQRFDDPALGQSGYHIYLQRLFQPQLGETDGGDTAAAARLVRDSLRRERALAALPPRSAEAYFAELSSGDLYGTAPLARGLRTLARFKDHYPQSPHLPYLESRAAIRQSTAPGQPAPDFAFTTTGGRTVRLSDLKGKVVLLDFWASWCGPCIAEMPHAKKLEEQFKGRNVVFVSVSIDEDAEAWTAALSKYSPVGMQTRLEGGWAAPAFAQYGATGVPAYFLIDTDGKLADATYARPSNGEWAAKAIEALLK